MPAPGSVAAKDADTRRKQHEEQVRANRNKESLEANKFGIGPVKGNFEAFKKRFRGALSGLDFSGTENDASWYNSTPELVRDVANVSFYSPSGTRAVQIEFSDEDKGSVAIPGIQKISYVPTFGPFFKEGLEGSGVDALNIAAQQLYVKVRSVNSGAVNYAPVDLAMVVLAFDSMFSTLAKLRRIYSAISTYSSRNYYLGKYLVQSMGFSESDINFWVNNLANYRYKYNVLVSKVNAISVPAGIPLFIRHAWLESNFFKDSETENSQITYFDSQGYYKYESNGGPANLNCIVAHSFGTTISEVFQALEEMVTVLMTDTDVGTICGDIVKAFGMNGVVTASTMEENVPLELFYSAEVNNQIDNATIHPIIFDGGYGKLGVYQNSSGVLYFGYDNDDLTGAIGPKEIVSYHMYSGEPAPTISGHFMDNTLMLNSYDKSEPSVDDVMVYTRLMSVVSKTPYVVEGDRYYPVRNVISYGSEIVTDVTIYTLSQTADNLVELVTNNCAPIQHIANDEQASILAGCIMYEFDIKQVAATFFHHPKIRSYPILNSSTTIYDGAYLVHNLGPAPTNSYTFSDISNVDQVAYINKDVLNRIHEVALLSLLGVNSKSKR